MNDHTPIDLPVEALFATTEVLEVLNRMTAALEKQQDFLSELTSLTNAACGEAGGLLP